MTQAAPVYRGWVSGGREGLWPPRCSRGLQQTTDTTYTATYKRPGACNRSPDSARHVVRDLEQWWVVRSEEVPAVGVPRDDVRVNGEDDDFIRFINSSSSLLKLINET